MVMNVEKLFQYIEDEVILEFNSDEECMNYFNTYDSQNFKTIKEMKKYQGKYGFNIGHRRYHINYDFALDIYRVEKSVFPEYDRQLVYAALMAYGNKMHELAKEVPNEMEISDMASKRSKEAWMLAKKIISEE